MNQDLKKAYINAVLNRDILTLIMFEKNKPSKIYRYRAGVGKGPDGELYDLTTLKNDTIYFTSAANQNDASDSRLDWSSFHPLLDDSFSYREQKKTFIACFTEIEPRDNKAEYFWREYSNEMKGFCLEYDMNSFKDKKLLLIPVVYEDNPKHEVDAETIIAQEIATKDSTRWGREDEWRIVLPGKGGEIESPMPKKIYLGKECYKNKELYDGLIRIAKEKGIEIEQM